MSESYTLTEATRVTGRSRATLRRYLDAGRFPNAFRNQGGETEAWQIPLEDLQMAGIAVTGDPSRSATGDTSTEVAELRQQLAVAQALATERARTIELLTSQLEQLQTTLRALAARS